MPLLVAEAQLRAVRLATGKTVLVRVQVCPPRLSAKLAVPAADGVPVMVKLRLPAPLASVPAARVAVRPVTPVEVTLCPVKVPPLPPVYGTELLTPEAAAPEVSVPELVAPAQFNAVMAAAGRFTVLVKVQVCPPRLSAKLAVPLLAGVPVML